MKIERPMNTFRLIGQLSEASGRRFRREMTIATSESFDEISERAERLLVGGRENVELDSFMLIPAPTNDKSDGPTDTEGGPSRWAKAMNAAAEAIGLKQDETPPGTIVKRTSVQEIPSVIPPVSPLPIYSRPYVAAVVDAMKAEDGIVAIDENLAVLPLDATTEETEICFESKT